MYDKLEQKMMSTMKEFESLSNELIIERSGAEKSKTNFEQKLAVHAEFV